MSSQIFVMHTTNICLESWQASNKVCKPMKLNLEIKNYRVQKGHGSILNLLPFLPKNSLRNK
jgi:hypothetical protein